MRKMLIPLLVTLLHRLDGALAASCFESLVVRQKLAVLNRKWPRILVKFNIDDATPGPALKLAFSVLRGERQGSPDASRRHETRSDIAKATSRLQQRIVQSCARDDHAGTGYPDTSRVADSGDEAVAGFFGDDIHPGDVIMHNDPAYMGSHMIDTCMYKPVFYKGEHVFWAVCKGHLTNIGGPVTAGYNPDATEIYAAGWCGPVRPESCKRIANFPRFGF